MKDSAVTIAISHPRQLFFSVILPYLKIPTGPPTPSQSWSWVTFSKPNPTQNFWTQPNPTHKSLHPTQPNPSSTLGMAY